jgi:hypothetical protein
MKQSLDSHTLWRIDLDLCAGEFRIGRLSEAGFRHHLRRLGFAEHDLAAEVEWHRRDAA